MADTVPHDALPLAGRPAEIHPTAIVDPQAELAAGVRIGPYCVVSAGAVIGPDSVLENHVTIMGRVVIGARNRVFPNCVIGGEPQDVSYRGSAPRVEIGDDQLAGVARSSRAGTKRSVKARPTRRPWPALIGRVPRIQTLRSPFFSRIVVMLAVVILDSVSLRSFESGVVCTVSPFGKGRVARSFEKTLRIGDVPRHGHDRLSGLQAASGSAPYWLGPLVPGRKPTSIRNHIAPISGTKTMKIHQPDLPRSW